MFFEKSVLLARINSAINRNDCLKRVDDNNQAGELTRPPLLSKKEESAFEAFALETISRLEKRIVSLEEQNDRLLYFIHYLYENLPSSFSPGIPGVDISEKKPQELLKNYLPGREQPTLTPREAEVLNLLIEGLCAKEIAKILFICETTVITHKRNLKEKFQARNTVELISKTIHMVR